MSDFNDLARDHAVMVRTFNLSHEDKRLMVQPKPLAFLIDTPRTRTPIVRLEYAHVIKNDFKSLED